MTGQKAGRPANRPGRPVYDRRDARDEDGEELCVLYSLGRCPDSDKPACQGQGRRLLHKVRPERAFLVVAITKTRPLLTVCSGNEYVTSEAMPEDKAGTHAGTGLPSVEPIRKDEGGSPTRGAPNKELQRNCNVAMSTCVPNIKPL